VIPSLVAGELKESLVEYLATTFALTEDEARVALTNFLMDERVGIFRGPFLRVRLPFIDAEKNEDTQLIWTPPGLRPYAHQLKAWQRLSGRSQVPQPTLVTTGTGSGKSEAFLIPAIDHAIWARGRGQRGIKALLLYPMNALVTDQERRVAALLADPAVHAAGVRGGVWIGDDGSTKPRREMDGSHLITDSNELLANPPDILLTNYKMLDRLLTNASRRELWAANTRPTGVDGNWQQPLTYLVLDEFHTYDGAQGTDVAMLLRRLGHRLGTNTDLSPLTGVGCIGTSATLGTSQNAIPEMLSFASKIFGTRFDALSVIGEQRQSVADVCHSIDFSLPIPSPESLIPYESLDRDMLALAFTGVGFDEAIAVGERLLRHNLTAALLRVAADRPRQWSDAVVAIAQQIQPWGEAMTRSPEAVSHALEQFVSLVSQARGQTTLGTERPLFSVEVQLWIREVTRLKRKVTLNPSFRWADSPADLTDEAGELDMPSVYCITCGRSGWLGVVNKAAGHGEAAIDRLVYGADSGDPYSTFMQNRSSTRTMIRANPNEADVYWLDSESGQVLIADSEEALRIPVLVAGLSGSQGSDESLDEAAKRQMCPSCGARDSMRFLGSRVTTLASVGITQFFGSHHVADDERKLLAFADSVQDASHRAAFFSGRTHRFNLRATLSAALQSKGVVALPYVAEVVLARADQGHRPEDDLFSLIPPDLLLQPGLDAAWRKPGSKSAVEARLDIAERLSFDAILEAGLRSRLGRTLETTGTAVAEVIMDEEEWNSVVAFGIESVQAEAGKLFIDHEVMRSWVAGILERLRTRGGIFHPFLDEYIREYGRRWTIWGGSHPLAPKFPSGISAPSFFASSSSEEFDPISGAQSWLRLWSTRVLDIQGVTADNVLRSVLDHLTTLGVLEQRSATKGLVWGLPATRIQFVDIALADGRIPSSEIRCGVCSHRHYAQPHRLEEWVGRPCMRLRCQGVYQRVELPARNYWQNLYRSGKVRRVVAAEHTSMLTRERRERLENEFKGGSQPDAPNVLTATPTLELGIDIGDLSAVMLTAVPPTQSNYVQRVGRAGRRTGNAFVTTFAEGDARSLYFLNDPELMIAGDIIPPSCYLDAIEILRRQYLAFLIDQTTQATDGLIPNAGQMPKTIGQVSSSGLNENGWLTVLLETGKSPAMVGRFISLFGQQLDSDVAGRLTTWAALEMSTHVERVIDRWRAGIDALNLQRNRLREREKPLKELANPSVDDEEQLGRVTAELRYVAGRIGRAKGEDTLGGLEALGLLPNYTLFDNTVTLQVSMWERNDHYDPGNEQSSRFTTNETEYVRPASIAIRELAPGNYFYVDGHRLRIDAVDIGTEHEPAHTFWRFCPSCSWSTDDGTAAVTSCPRCGDTGIADLGSVFPVLPLRLVSSTERESSARVGDDSEDRLREFHKTVTTIDIAPEDITAAYLHRHTVFGVEAARAAKITTLNLGLEIPLFGSPRQLKINGETETAALFTVCRYCGSVKGVRGDLRNDNDPKHHRTWCTVRSGANREQWDAVALSHELVTEAVRILLPIAEFEAKERVLSFKAALFLGLRDSFGGDPSHLRVMTSDFPSSNTERPDERNRFVVIHDTVPGGTGYLPRLADPVRLQQILSRAVELITTCECQTRGLPGCHRCLYGSVGRHELPLVSRELALSILDEILINWDLAPAEEGTITGVNLTEVRQSELERMFKSLLHRWSNATQKSDQQKVRITARPDAEQTTRTRFDLLFQDGPQWEIREQVPLHQHGTVPDFWAERVDAPGTPPLAIYLDGWEFHGKDVDKIDGDAMRRDRARQSGIPVWIMTWGDVRGALNAVQQGTTLISATAVSKTVRTEAVKIAGDALGSSPRCFRSLDDGAFEQMMQYLAHPDAPAWNALAAGVALAAGAPKNGHPVADFAGAIAQEARHESLALADHETGIRITQWASQNHQLAATVLVQGHDRPSVVLSYDTTIDTDQLRWAEWLHLSNLLQFLGDRAIITTSTTFDSTGEFMEGPGPKAASLVDIADEIYDTRALELTRAAVAAGFDQFEVGFPSGDVDDTPIEVVWPEAKVGILPAGVARPSTLEEWELRASDHWTLEDLLATLRRRSEI
jgi:ATP-dependent helicase YprA (DUF1998 family)